MRRIVSRINRRNAKWFARTCGWSWLIQGTLYGVLSVAGMGSLAAIATAKVTSYVVWLGQCIQHAREE